MNKKMLSFLGIVLFAVGIVDILNIVDFIPNTISWVLAIIGVVLLIASNFIAKEKPDR